MKQFRTDDKFVLSSWHKEDTAPNPIIPAKDQYPKWWDEPVKKKNYLSRL
jgi:hypothetical protein